MNSCCRLSSNDLQLLSASTQTYPRLHGNRSCCGWQKSRLPAGKTNRRTIESWLFCFRGADHTSHVDFRDLQVYVVTDATIRIQHIAAPTHSNRCNRSPTSSAQVHDLHSMWRCFRVAVDTFTGTVNDLIRLDLSLDVGPIRQNPKLAW